MERILVIDLEATCCDRGTVPRERMEIIEVGGALATWDGDVLGTFVRFVRPQEHPTITPFCTELTSITQQDVDGASIWKDVAKELDAFATKHKVTTWGSWGGYDLRQIIRESKRKKVDIPLKRLTHVNIKAEFRRVHKVTMGMSEAMQLVGLPLIGTHHRGIDDAVNIAHMLPYCRLP